MGTGSKGGDMRIFLYFAFFLVPNIASAREFTFTTLDLYIQARAAQEIYAHAVPRSDPERTKVLVDGGRFFGYVAALLDESEDAELSNCAGAIGAEKLVMRSSYYLAPMIVHEMTKDYRGQILESLKMVCHGWNSK
jgi:hypothetical protein